MSRILAVGIFLGVLAANGANAQAQNPAPTDEQARAQITSFLRIATEQLDLKEYRDALGALTRALGLVRQAHLEADPVAAAVERTIGVAAALAGQPDDALPHFRAAFRIDPKGALEPRWTAPEVKATFARAQESLPQAAPATAKEASDGEAKVETPSGGVATESGPTDAGKKAGMGDSGAKSGGLRAHPVTETELGKPLAIEAQLGADVAMAARVVLLYRRPGTTRFTEIAMDASPTGYQASIPGTQIRPPAVEYYIEARDAKNRPLARRGNPDRPLALGVATPAEPVARASSPRKRKRSAESGPVTAPARKPKGEDDENPFDAEHDPSRVVPPPEAKTP